MAEGFLPIPLTKKDIRGTQLSPLRIGWFPTDAYNHFPIRKSLTLAAGASGQITVPVKTGSNLTYLAAVGYVWRSQSLFSLSAGSVNWPATNGLRASLENPFYFQPPVKVKDTITFSITNNSANSQTYEFLAYLLSTADYNDEMAQTDLTDPYDYSNRTNPYAFNHTTPYQEWPGGLGPPPAQTYTVYTPPTSSNVMITAMQITLLQISGGSGSFTADFYIGSRKIWSPRNGTYTYILSTPAGTTNYTDFTPYAAGGIADALTFKWTNLMNPAQPPFYIQFKIDWWGWILPA